VEFLPDPVVLVIDNALSEGDSVRFFESNSHSLRNSL
jgi:hypothetical protein